MRRLGLFFLMTGLLSAGCISAKTSFRDYSDLGATPFDYVQKNASYTHTTVKGLCLFRSNPYLGSGPMYQGLHDKYDLGPNEAFINQRFDQVSKFYIFFCERDYTLSADIVRFSHGETEPSARNLRQANALERTIEPAPSRTTTGPVTVTARAELTVSCPGIKEITGRPNPTTRKTTIKLLLERPESCRIRVGEVEKRVVLSPGDTKSCREVSGTLSCRRTNLGEQAPADHRMRYSTP